MKSGLLNLAGAVFLLGGVPILFASLLLPVITSDEYLSRPFLAPGSIQAEVDTPGRYYLWHDYQALRDGRAFTHPIPLPDGMSVSISDANTGEQLEFTPDMSSSLAMGEERSQSVGYVEIEEPRTVIVEVAGSEDQPRALTFSQSRLPGIFRAIGMGALLSLPLLAGGILLLVSAIARMSARDTPSTPANRSDG